MQWFFFNVLHLGLGLAGTLIWHLVASTAFSHFERHAALGAVVHMGFR